MVKIRVSVGVRDGVNYYSTVSVRTCLVVLARVSTGPGIVHSQLRLAGPTDIE